MAWLAVMGAALVSISVPPTAPRLPTDDVLGCDAVVFDPAGELEHDVIEAEAAQLGRRLGADVHIRAERSVDSGLDERMAQLERACPSWSEGSERASDLVVVMYSSVEREASVYYGADQGPLLEDRWEPAVDAMTERFRAGDFTEGVLASIQRLQQPGSATSDIDDDTRGDDTGSSNNTTGIALFVAALVVGLLVCAWRYTSGDGGPWEDGVDGVYRGADGGSSSWWRSSNRTRSFGGFRSSSRSSSSRRSSSSSRRSSGGSRRSGGGTKKW